MMKCRLGLAALLIFSATRGLTADAAPTIEYGMLRIVCEGDNKNAEIFINGKPKGACPFDVQVAAGFVIVRAVKSTGVDREKIFEEDLRLGGDVVRRVEVALGEPRMSAAAVKRLTTAEQQTALQKEQEQRAQLPALVQAAEAGDARAMLRLGIIYEDGLSGPVDYAQAASWFSRAATMGDHTAKMKYYRYRRDGQAGVVADKAAAAMLLKEAAEKDGEAMLLVGTYCLIGAQGYPKDKLLSREWIEKGANAGNWRAMDRLSSLLKAYGSGPAADQQLAAAWLNKALPIMQSAADNGDWVAAYSLGFWYEYGIDTVAVDTDKAEKLNRQVLRQRRKAADAGDPEAMLFLAESYTTGEFGISKNRGEAVKLYRQAKDKGSTEAEKKLSELGEL